MFGATSLGATVSYDPGTKTATVSKPGSEIKVTVGKPEVLINGESRPLDVPPMIYQGNVLVPVRVISEGMGAYVQWVPDQHVVVVRYLPATPPPPPASAPAAATTADAGSDAQTGVQGSVCRRRLCHFTPRLQPVCQLVARQWRFVQRARRHRVRSV